MKITTVYLIENIACLATIVFGVHGCATDGHGAYAIAIAVGLLWINTGLVPMKKPGEP